MADTNTTPPAAPAADPPADAPAAAPKKAAKSAPRLAKVGDFVLVTVNPDGNNGHDCAPALVTSVDKGGRIHALVYQESTAPPLLLGGLEVFADRAAVDAMDDSDDADVRAKRPGFAAYFRD